MAIYSKVLLKSIEISRSKSNYSPFILHSVSPLLHRLLTLDLTTLATAEMPRSSSETSLASSTTGSSTAVSTIGDWANDDTELLIKSETSTPCHHNTRSILNLSLSWHYGFFGDRKETGIIF